MPLTPHPPPESFLNGEPKEEGGGSGGGGGGGGGGGDGDPATTDQDYPDAPTVDQTATGGPPAPLPPQEDDQHDQVSMHGAIAMEMTPTVVAAAAVAGVAGGGIGGRAAALVAAARAVMAGGAGQPKQQRLATAGGYPCGQCDRVFMSMQGLRSHERSHSAMAMFSREDKYTCQYCQFVSPFRHK